MPSQELWTELQLHTSANVTSSTLKMEAAYYSKILASVYNTTQFHDLKDLQLSF
jgi:hypothetical protein